MKFKKQLLVNGIIGASILSSVVCPVSQLLSPLPVQAANSDEVNIANQAIRNFIINKSYSAYLNKSSSNKVTYYVGDLNNDGVNDLILYEEDALGWGFFYVFTFRNGSVQHLDIKNNYTYGGVGYSPAYEAIVWSGKPSIYYEYHDLYTLGSTSMEYIFSLGRERAGSAGDTYYKVLPNGSKTYLTEAEYNSYFTGISYLNFVPVSDFSMLPTGTANYQTGWIQVGSNWRYILEDGSYPKSSWREISGKRYYFDENGNMLTGWLNNNGQWYYLSKSSGHLLTGWQYINNKWYYLDSKSGCMKTGWIKDGSKWFYLTQSGEMASNRWVTSNGNSYYLQNDGSMAVNTVINGYKVGSDGAWIPASNVEENNGTLNLSALLPHGFDRQDLEMIFGCFSGFNSYLLKYITTADYAYFLAHWGMTDLLPENGTLSKGNYLTMSSYSLSKYNNILDLFKIPRIQSGVDDRYIKTSGNQIAQFYMWDPDYIPTVTITSEKMYGDTIQIKYTRKCVLNYTLEERVFYSTVTLTKASDGYYYVTEITTQRY